MTGLNDFDPVKMVHRMTELNGQAAILLSQRDRLYFDARDLRGWLQRIADSTEDVEYLRRLAITALDLLPERDLTVRRLPFGPGGPTSYRGSEIPIPDESRCF